MVGLLVESNICKDRDWAVLGAHNIMEHLPGYLIRNQSFVHECKKYFSSDKHASMFEDMLKSQNDPEGGWTSNQLLCPACLSIFIRENIVSWLVMQLIRGGFPNLFLNVTAIQ